MKIFETPDMNRSVKMTDMIKSKKITAEDVFALRSHIYKDGVTSQKQAATLIALEKVCRDSCQEWSDYYITSLGDYLLCRCEPHGGISDENTQWLKRVLTENGLVRSANEFSLLKSLLERAVPAAPSFCALVLEQLHQAMLGYDDIEAGYSVQNSHLAGSVDVLDQMAQTRAYN